MLGLFPFVSCSLSCYIRLRYVKSLQWDDGGDDDDDGDGDDDDGGDGGGDGDDDDGGDDNMETLGK